MIVSQAIYCLECVQKGDPSRRDGMSRASRCVHRPRNVRRFVLPTSLAAVKAQKNTAPRIRWIRRAAVPPRTIRKNLRCYTGSAFRVFQMICLSKCTNRFSCILQDLLFFHQTVVIYWRAECWDGAVGWRFEYISSVELLSGVLSVTDTINFQQQFACKLLSSATAIRTWIRSFPRLLMGN
jgi:hypothetical protein